MPRGVVSDQCEDFTLVQLQIGVFDSIDPAEVLLNSNHPYDGVSVIDSRANHEVFASRA
jgi:hypothetical protein